MRIEDLSPELQEKARECQTPEELLALAKQEGYELTEEELEQVAGGLYNNSCPTFRDTRRRLMHFTKAYCPNCGAPRMYYYPTESESTSYFECDACHRRYTSY